jgi:hypothetical protein
MRFFVFVYEREGNLIATKPLTPLGSVWYAFYYALVESTPGGQTVAQWRRQLSRIIPSLIRTLGVKGGPILKAFLLPPG